MTTKGRELGAAFEQMYADLAAWRAAHPEAGVDEIAAQITPRRRRLMGALLADLALQHGNGYAMEGLTCSECGGPLVYKGTPGREVLHLEAEAELERAYYHCPHCERGFFPPGPPAGAGAS